LTVGVGMLAAWLLAGCGGSGDSGQDVPGETAQYLPLAVGNVWEYNYTEYTAPTGIKSVRPSIRPHRPYVGTKQLSSTDTVTVTGISVIGGQEWYSVVYQYIGEPALPAIYMRHNAAGLLKRLSADSQPFFVLKNPVAPGTNWTVSWIDENDNPQTSRLTVRSLDETIATPAGTYTNCLQIEDVLLGNESDVLTYWYAPNVGEVREEHHVGNDLKEQLELTAFTPAAVGL
jgi:hypothetical protein